MPLYTGVLHFSLSDALHTRVNIEEYKYACYVIYREKRFIWDFIDVVDMVEWQTRQT